jgi:glycerol-3-phosphate acyltransferase PlsX
MPIAVDAMGGDFAPQSAVEGAFQAAREDGCSILLVGDRARLEAELRKHGSPGFSDGRIEIVHAEEVVGMDEPAITPIRKKRRSSLRLAAELVKDGRAAAMVTAGNTGAAMIAAKMVIGTVSGVDRPALAAVLPNRQGRTLLLDVGANIDTKPVHLREFAVMGHFYAQEVIGTPSPRIGLMSIGEEEGKGTDLTREVFKVLKTTGLNFVGNVEGGDVFDGSVDVIVCDGFVGNVVLKSSEALAEFILRMLREEIAGSPRG